MLHLRYNDSNTLFTYEESLGTPRTATAPKFYLFHFLSSYLNSFASTLRMVTIFLSILFLNTSLQKAKGWVSGQRVEECGDKLTPGDAIVDNMKSALKGVSGFPDITSANDCTAKCSEVADCQYYKFNKKKGCFLLQIQHVEAGGWFTA